MHKDHANLPYGWCAITALGSFDCTRGGHLIFWELGLVIQFPPGSAIFIPSASVTHSNTPIASGEKHFSMIQYTAGSIFRWVDHGFKSDKDYYASLTEEGQKKDQEETQNRLKMGLSLFSKVGEFKASKV